MTNVQKIEIVDAIDRAKTVYESYNKVADVCGVSSATISNMRNGVEHPEKWVLIKTQKWQDVAKALNVNLSGWQIAETMDLRMMRQVLQTAKDKSLFQIVAHPAGGGKTTGADVFLAEKPENCYYIKCRKWGERELLLNLLQVLGIKKPTGVVSLDDLRVMVINFFVGRLHVKPLLIIDQSNSLRKSGKGFLIDLFNEVEDLMGVVLLGTEALQKDLEKGVRLGWTGYDEILSRFGRVFIQLIGATEKCVAAMCEVNGVTSKRAHKEIFDECNPVVKQIEVKKGEKQNIAVVADKRRVKRRIQKELLKQNYESAA